MNITQYIERPKQEKYPNLNAGNPAPKGNNYGQLWKTEGERQVACLEYCDYLKQGRDPRFYRHSQATINYYMENYSKEFISEQVEEAVRIGLGKLEGNIIAAAIGKVPKANAQLMVFIAKNKLDWKDKTDITSDGDKIEMPTIFIPEEKE